MPDERESEKPKKADATPATPRSMFDEAFDGMRAESERRRGETKPSKFVPGYAFQGGLGESWVILAVDKANDLYLLRDKTATEAGHVYKLTAEHQARLKQIEFEGKTYYCETGGGVYSKTGKPGEFRTEPQLCGLDKEWLRLERSTAKEKVLDNLRGEYRDKQEQKTIDGSKMSVRTSGSADRIVEIDGVRYRFGTDVSSWFGFSQPFRGPDGQPLSHCDTKVHVTTVDAVDLGRVQAALIPELVKAASPGGELFGKLANFKTHDPMYAVDGSWETRFGPGPDGQRSKGFTIYATTPEAARDIQLYVDKFLKDKGLTLDAAKAKTGNVGDKTLLDKGSNRVSFEKSHLEPAGFKHRVGGLLTDVMEKAVIELAEKRVKEKSKGWEAYSKAADLYESDGKRFKAEVLQLLNAEFGIDGLQATLAYDDTRPGEKGRARLALCAGHTSEVHSGRYYLDESRAQKTVERDGTGKITTGLTGRAAYYEMGDVLKRELGYKENLAVFGDGADPQREKPSEVRTDSESQTRQKTSARNRGPADKVEVGADRGEVRSQGDTTFVMDKAPSAEVQKILDKWTGKEKTLERDLAKAIGKMPDGDQRKQMEDQLAKLVGMEEGATKDGIKRAMAELVVESRKPGFRWDTATGRIIKAAGAAGTAVAVGMLVQVLLANEPGYTPSGRTPVTPTFGG